MRNKKYYRFVFEVRSVIVMWIKINEMRAKSSPISNSNLDIWLRKLWSKYLRGKQHTKFERFRHKRFLNITKEYLFPANFKQKFRKWQIRIVFCFMQGINCQNTGTCQRLTMYRAPRRWKAKQTLKNISYISHDWEFKLGMRYYNSNFFFSVLKCTIQCSPLFQDKTHPV